MKRALIMLVIALSIVGIGITTKATIFDHDIQINGVVVFPEGATPLVGNEWERYRNNAIRIAFDGFDKGLRPFARLTPIFGTTAYFSERLWPFFPSFSPGPNESVALNLEYNAATANAGRLSFNMCGLSGLNPGFSPGDDCVSISLWFEYDLFGAEDIVGTGIDIAVASGVSKIKGTVLLPNGHVNSFEYLTINKGDFDGTVPEIGPNVLPYPCGSRPDGCSPPPIPPPGSQLEHHLFHFHSGGGYFFRALFGTTCSPINNF